MKVLYAVQQYPHLSESYVETEIRWMNSQGVDIQVHSGARSCTEIEPGAPVHRESLAQAVQAFKPDLIHIHWLVYAEILAEQLQQIGLPVTVRGHSFCMTDERLKKVLDQPTVKNVFLFPHFISTPHPKLIPVTSCYDPELYEPLAAPNTKTVVRASAGLPTKALTEFMDVAKLCPDFKFILLVTRAPNTTRVIDDLTQANIDRGSPVTLKVDCTHGQVAWIVSRAAIYLHTSDPKAHPFGMPVSICEAMGTGAWVLVRHSPAALAYIVDAGTTYETVQEAAEFINLTKNWDDAAWEQVRKNALDRAERFKAENVLPGILNAWRSLVG